MSDSLLEQANKAAVAAVRADRPTQFTVGGYRMSDGSTRATVTFDRHWSNGWGATAFVYAWWNDASVTAHPTLEAGAEVTKKF